MIAANPPGHFLCDAKTTDEQIHRYTDVCAKDESCTARTDDLLRTLRQTNDDIPARWAFLLIKEGNVRVATFYGAGRVVIGSSAALRSNDAGLLAVRGRRRCERVLVPVAARRSGVPILVHLG